MNYTRHEKKDGKIKIDFVLSAKEWESDVENAYQKNKGKYKKEGFRQGKVPRKVLENTYGDFMFYEDAFNDAFPTYFSKFLMKEKDIVPVDYPDVKIEKMDKSGVNFSAEVTLMPEFKLGKYKGISVEKNTIAVSSAEITKEMENLRQKNARLIEITDRAVKKGDLINLDYSGSADGKVFDGGTAKDQELEIGSNTFIPGFEDQIVGMKIGEEKDIKVTFPKQYHSKELAGKEAVFAVKILSIREKQLPKLDDEFVKDVSEFDSLTDLSLDIESKLAEKKEHTATREVEQKLVSAIVDNVEMDVPDIMIEKQLDFMLSDLEKRLSYQGMTLDIYFGYIGKSEADFRKDNRAEAKRAVKTSLVIEEIIKIENIQVESSEVSDKFDEIAKLYNRPVDEIKKYFVDENLESVKREILSDKVMKFLKENNKIVEEKSASSKPAQTKVDKKEPKAPEKTQSASKSSPKKTSVSSVAKPKTSPAKK